jgi:hypothetical protein
VAYVVVSASLSSAMRFAGMHFLDDVKETARANQSDNADLLRLNN